MRHHASYRSASTVDGPQRRGMQCRGVFVHYCCRLGSAVASRVVEIHCVDTILAKRTPKFGAAIHRFGRVISHFLNCKAFYLPRLGAKGVHLWSRARRRLNGFPKPPKLTWHIDGVTSPLHSLTRIGKFSISVNACGC